MNNPTTLVVRTDANRSEFSVLTELVMAWARDRVTGKPRYILELGTGRNGASCGCDCASCGLPLTAVNAGKTEFIHRPHFRHPKGTEASACSVLTARMAALHMLICDGVLDLPSRRMSATVVGLSGRLHEGWVNAPALRVRIANVDFHDRTMAMLTLDDGRQLRVLLTGSSNVSSQQFATDGLLCATIFIDTDDPAVSGLPPEEILKRLKLLPSQFSWCSYWEDAELAVQAEVEALSVADDALDWHSEDIILQAGSTPQQKRETLLHFEVKKILANAVRVHVPALLTTVERAEDIDSGNRDHWYRTAEYLRLTDIALERRFEHIVPDVMCTSDAEDGTSRGMLFIEVTVSNGIDDERKGRIEEAGQATLEIDLSITGGRVTRKELRALVIDGLEIKRWVFHPELVFQRIALDNAHEARTKARKDKFNAMRDGPLADISAAYLAAVEHLARKGSLVKCDVLIMIAARSALDEAVQNMTLRGYPEAGDNALTDCHGIIARILSIQKDEGIGCALPNGHAVLKAIRQLKYGQRKNWTLYLIAVRVYQPALNAAQMKWLNDWRKDLEGSLRNEDDAFMREPVYDRILTLIFPEMAAALARPIGKMVLAVAKSDEQGETMLERRRSAVRRLASERQSSGASPHSSDENLTSAWLTGCAYEEWKRANPEAAQVWENS